MNVIDRYDAPSILEGSTMLTYKNKLLLYGGLGNGLNNFLFVFNPLSDTFYFGEK